MVQKAKQGVPMRQMFRDVCLRLAEEDDKVVLVFGDISVYLFNSFTERYPERFINAGICENTLISISAGLSARGYHPFVHSINPFLTERSLEQIKLDMCYNDFGGNIVTCGASFDYAWDGSTHHSYGELSTLRLIPGIEVMQPGSSAELECLIIDRYNNGKTSYFRTSDAQHEENLPITFGKGVVLRDSGSDVTLITSGPLLKNVLEACAELSVNIVYFHTLKPFDYDLVKNFSNSKILVVEDAHGLYESVCQIPDIRVACHGLPDQFICTYGKADDIRRVFKLDTKGIRDAVLKRLSD